MQISEPKADAETVVHQWQEINRLIYDFGAFSVYDNPCEAIRYGTITSSHYLGHDKWQEWMHEHYIGDSGYDHETGKIINEKQRKFFDAMYPDWSQEQSCQDADDDFGKTDIVDVKADASLNYMGGWSVWE